MSETAKSPKAEKTVEDRLSDLEKLYAKLNKIVQFISRQLERVFGRDFNSDGKIGSTRIAAILLVALMAVGVARAASQLIKWTGTNGNYVAVMDDGSIRSVSGSETNDYPAAGGFTSATLNKQTVSVVATATAQTGALTPAVTKDYTTLTYLTGLDTTGTASVVTNVYVAAVTAVTNIATTAAAAVTNGTISLQ